MGSHMQMPCHRISSSSLGIGRFVTFIFLFFFYLGKGPVMFNFETRSNFICMPGIFSTKGTSQLLAWRGLMPTVPVESRLYFPVGSVWGLTLGSQMCTQLLKLCLYNWGEAVTGTQQNQRNVF